ncbi:HAD hydrolase-like protein [Saccharothrix obliqua]|uniref:HAD hydrolase-like protein n=1 Tax=Saccharothrix obliqua TaxID=2861747 RepID=UPI001C5EA8F9|nr:HAD hydrolase-like protein [Saccharothrix obliqua]MBW4717191.1 HAD hydrolase-like protein [Saccharothrix obliqua]
MRAEELRAEWDHVLVALDGPVAGALATGSVADRLRTMVGEDRLPWEVSRTRDPYVVLAHARTIGPATERAVRAQWRRVEHAVVAAAQPVPGVRDAFAALVAGGVQITVVAALDVAAVRAFLVLHGLEEHVRRLVGRAESDRVAPDLVPSAVHAGALPARSCVFIGSAPADLAAARAAGVTTIRHRRAETGTDDWFAALSTPTRGRRRTPAE